MDQALDDAGAALNEAIGALKKITSGDPLVQTTIGEIEEAIDILMTIRHRIPKTEKPRE